VPYLERYGKRYITNRAEPPNVGCFELSNPEGMSAWVDERQRITNGTFVKVIRLAKYLRDYKDTFTCVSIILTTLLGNEVNEIQASRTPTLYEDVPSSFVTLMTRLAGSLPPAMPAVMDPAGTGDNFTDRYRSGWDYQNFRTHIRFYAAKAKQAYEEGDRSRSIALWQEIFGTAFSPSRLVKSSSLAPLSAAVAWSGEQHIDRAPYNYAIRRNPEYKVRVNGRCSGGPAARKNGFRQFDLSKNGYRVAKHRSLRFTATTNAPRPYSLYWKVRNGGPEAGNLNALRGEITQDAGENSKTESTLYKGTHYVECYVVKDGAVVARDRETVIVTT
jgi:hypothetical protein